MSFVVGSFGRMRIAQRAGQRTSAQTQESPTEPAIVIPNWVKKVPDVPDMKVTGMKTAIKTRVHEITATDTSLRASRVACVACSLGEPLILPVSSFAITASTTTMASSTTVPIASTKAKRVRILRENPASCTIAKVPSRETTIEIEGMRVAFQF